MRDVVIFIVIIVVLCLITAGVNGQKECPNWTDYGNGVVECNP